jgi:hypothetical protein
MSSKKRVHLQQFGVVHLSNSDLTYIRNPEIETKLCYAIPPLKNLHQEPQYRNKIIFMSFHLFCYGTDVPQMPTRIYAHAEGRDAKLLLMPIELHAPTSSTQKLKPMSKGGQFTYTQTPPLTCKLPRPHTWKLERGGNYFN